MKFNYQDLIDRYHYNEFSKEEMELFYLSLEFNPLLRSEFNFYLKLKYFITDGQEKKVKEFLLQNQVI
ncbi:MAG: hypothetical protein KKG99_14400 [Bacteroidetes bacterium]|nr:hypothetical protein [Bacteroidota bacterium]